MLPRPPPPADLLAAGDEGERAVREAFAGEDYEKAVFYREDDRFLVERDLVATHYQVEASSLP